MSRQTFSGERTVIEKADPYIMHDAPASVAEGTLATITFSIVDFDGAHRVDSGGVLLLEVDGTEVPLAVTDGTAALAMELYAAASVKQKPPYFCDARLESFRIEVTT